MSLPFKSLDAASTTGPGESRDLEGSFSHHTMVVSKTGGGGGTVRLEGSHDGSVWVSLATQGFSNPSDDDPAVRSTTTDHMVRHVRANLVDAGAGTSPTFTATIASDTGEEE